MQMQINETRYVVGTDMKCRTVVTKVTLLYVTECDANGFDCVIEERGDKCKAKTNELFATKQEALASIV